MNNETVKQERQTKLNKAVMIAVLSPLLTLATIGIGGAITGYVGAKDYENTTGKDLGFGQKLGYTLISAFGLGVFNPYMSDVLSN